MMAAAALPNVTTAGGRKMLPFGLNGHSVRAMITFDLGADSSASARGVVELADIPFCLITRCVRPMGSNSCGECF